MVGNVHWQEGISYLDYQLLSLDWPCVSSAFLCFFKHLVNALVITFPALPLYAFKHNVANRHCPD